MFYKCMWPEPWLSLLLSHKRWDHYTHENKNVGVTIIQNKNLAIQVEEGMGSSRSEPYELSG